MQDRDAENLVTIYRLANPYKAEIIRGALESDGIRCELGGTRQAGFTGTWDIEVLVRAADAERARAILAAHEADEAAHEP